MTMLVNKRYYQRRVHRYTPMQIEIAKALYDLWKPRSVFDAGCGIGGYLEGFKSCGCKIQGCDIGYKDAVYCMNDELMIAAFEHDLAKPLKHENKYDLVMSIEVAEHLEEENALQFCKNLVSVASNRILVTAAGLGQRGKHHVNCQPKKYWRIKFGSQHATFDSESTVEAIECIQKFKDPFGICKNLMVFRYEI